MKITRWSIGLGLGILLLIAGFACTKDGTIVSPDNSELVHLKGTVWGVFCGGEFWNQPHDPLMRRFSIYTGEPAYVTLIRDDGFNTTLATDDSSMFELNVSAGSYRIAIETGYSYPTDTVRNVLLNPGDTSIDLNTNYWVLDALNITCVFSYLTIHDTIGLAAESGVLQKLNAASDAHAKIKPVFNFNGGSDLGVYRRVQTSEYTPRVYCNYVIPINREIPEGDTGFNVLEAEAYLQSILDTDPKGQFPDNFSIYSTGAYICLAR